MRKVLDEAVIYEILSVVEEIPYGCVATYGQIARLIGRDKNARLVIGGKRHSAGELFYEPTIIAVVTAEMDVATQETFGPLAAIFKFETEQQAIEMANATEFGLAAYCYTQDLGRAWRMSEQLEYGMVGINKGLISNEVAPFGGIKQSGLGREGSKYGIEDYLEIKYTLFGGLG